MGLYPINCPSCDKPTLWFSGSTSQVCSECKEKSMNKPCHVCGATSEPHGRFCSVGGFQKTDLLKGSMETKYFESHITIEPVFGHRFDSFQMCCAEFNFKVATLLMQKNRTETEQRSNKDSFCTGHSKTYDDIHERMMGLVHYLTENGFEVWRYKIEAILLDEKLGRIR